MEIFIQSNSINVLIPRTPQMRLSYPISVGVRIPQVNLLKSLALWPNTNKKKHKSYDSAAKSFAYCFLFSPRQDDSLDIISGGKIFVCVYYAEI
jgi:hypothetical protein